MRFLLCVLLLWSVLSAGSKADVLRDWRLKNGRIETSGQAFNLIFDRFGTSDQRHGIVLIPEQTDWSQQRQLLLGLLNPAQDSVYLGIRIEDAAGQAAVWYEAMAVAEHQEVIVPLQALEGDLDFSQIRQLEIFVRRPRLFAQDPYEPVVLKLDKLCLEASQLSIGPPRMQSTPGLPQRQLIEVSSPLPADWQLEIFSDTDAVNKSEALSQQVFLRDREPRWIVNLPGPGAYRGRLKARQGEDQVEREWRFEVSDSQHSRPELTIWTQPGSLRPDYYALPPENMPQHPPSGSADELLLASGESEGLLIPMLADRALQIRHQLTAEGLKVKLWRVGYLQAWRPQELYRLGRPGWIADLLSPLPDNFTPVAGQLEALYLELQAPDQPGLYSLHLKLDWGTGRRELNWRIRTVSAPGWRKHMPLTAFSLYPEFFDRAYGAQSAWRWAEAEDLLAEHGLHPGSIYQPPLNSVQLDTLLRLGPERAWINLGYLDPERVEQSLPGLRAAYADLKARGRLDQAYVFAFDEYQGDPQRFLQAARLLERELPGVPVVSTARLFQLGREQGLDWPANVRWCPSLRDLELYTRLGTSIKQAEWAYVFIAQRPPYPNWFLESPLLESRLIPWLAWQQKLKGLLYYTTNRWIGISPDTLIQPQDFPLLSWRPNCFEDTNGDGCLIYPGREGALPGLRLKNLQQGFEDWALLRTVEARCGSEPLQRLSQGLISSPREFSLDVFLLESKARQLRKLLEDCHALG